MAKSKKDKTPPVATEPPKKGGKKSKQDSAPPEPEKPGKGKGRAVVANNSSWTGKLPGSLLHEYCQKQKWDKVIYDMAKTRDGFIGIAHLSWKNPKTQEIIEVKMIPEKSIVKGQETSLEARHYAATYALHRIAFDKNLHMVLPTNHKNLWSDLEAFRKKLTVENPEKAKELYNSDPFGYILEKRKADARKTTQKEAAAVQNAKVAKAPSLITTKTQSQEMKQAQAQKKQIPKKSVYQRTSFPRKVWESAPFIDLKPQSRDLISKSIRSHIDWSSHKSSQNPEDVSYKAFMVSLGFRSSHIEEALKYTDSFTETLEWLIFHLPEDDLPPMFAKSQKDSNVTLKVTGDLKKEYIIRRLSNAGFSDTDIAAALLKFDLNEVDAAIYLTYDLINYTENDEASIISDDDSTNIWEEEMQSLEVIYHDRFSRPEENICEIKLNAHNLEEGVLVLRVFRSKAYPHSLPGLHLLVSDKSYKLANYIRLSIVKRLLHFVLDNGILGDSCIFSFVDWLETEIHTIIEDPGPLFEEGQKILSEQPKAKSVSSKSTKAIKSRTLSSADIEKLTEQYSKHYVSDKMKTSVSKRASLPAWNKRDAIIDLINKNKVTLITGETGSGKSTQAVQFILDDMIANKNFNSSIICTQPRRISAIGLAERVADERCSKCGTEVGYIIRGENRTTKDTRISFVTTGVLLRMVQDMMATTTSKNSLLSNVGYIFIDEVHERSIDSDFLLIILKNILAKFPKLKIVLMSATTDVNVFRTYFHQGLAHIHIEGRTYPITDYYLDTILQDVEFTLPNIRGRYSDDFDDTEGDVDAGFKPKANSKFFQDGNINYDLISSVVNHVHDKLIANDNHGSLLIFLPGVAEITSCIKNITKSFKGNCLLLPLHSALSANDQKRVFQTPSRGVRKIVVSTNVAETSITIPDAVCVIDTGRSKNLYYDPRLNTTRLLENWCSQAEVGQRRGRAGRITDGLCYKLYTRSTENSMLKQPIPEIKRVRLENAYLVVKSIGIKDVREFLQSGLDPPDDSTLDKSAQFLLDIGAIASDGKLTHLGSYLAMLPTDLQSGKLLILGSIFGCVETALTLASISSVGTPFINSFEMRDDIKAVQQRFAQGQGDLIAIVNAYNEYDRVRASGGASAWLRDNHLSFLKLKEMRSTRTQYVSILKDLGFIPLDYSDKPYKHLKRNDLNWSIVKSIITGSFYPQITRVQLPDPKYLATLSGAVAIDPDDKETKLWIKNEKCFTANGQHQPNELPATRAFLHPSSSLFVGSGSDDGTKPQSLKSSFAIYNSSVHTAKYYIRDVTPSSVLSVLLFGGEFTYDLSDLQDFAHPSPGVILDNWSPIRTWCKNAVLIKQLRILLDNLISEKFSSPSYVEEQQNSDSILNAVETVLKLDALK